MRFKRYCLSLAVLFAVASTPVAHAASTPSVHAAATPATHGASPQLSHDRIHAVLSGRANITDSIDEFERMFDALRFLRKLPSPTRSDDDGRTNITDDPRTHMNVPELIHFYGYHCEVHRVTTEDGYIIELHRIKKLSLVDCDRGNGSFPGGCQPVFLQHGLLSSSASWIMNYPGKALAYILADLGYDVWMGNARGNDYSNGHRSLHTDSYEYWDFDFDQMAKYDLTAAISHVLKVSNKPKLHYVGHSMGTMMFWILENVRPGFAKEHVASMSALGPVAYVQYINVPLRLIAPLNRYLDYVLRDVMGIYNFLEPDNPMMRMLERVCRYTHASRLICANSIFLLVGFDQGDLDEDWVPVILHMLNGGTSIRTVIHFGQLTESKSFRAFDYHSGNWKHYHQWTPPTYSLGKVSVPVMLKYGLNDPLADPKDVDRMSKELPPSRVMAQVKNPKFSHLDFLWGKDAKEMVYDDVISFMEKHRIN